MLEELISIRTAAKRLQVSESSIRRYFDEGKLVGHTTPGGTRRILLESLETLEVKVGLSPAGITFK
tara:strand:- start:665 stop:862 length:198 start_codon:yes stop_codon:yes gene_type:complete